MLVGLLNLLGFDSEEVEKERNRIEQAFSILGIGLREISQGRERIEQFFDIELLGIRKVLGLWVKELVDLVLSKKEGKRVVYVSYPPVSDISAAIALASENIYCSPPEIVLNNTLNLIFGTINSVLETAERQGLKPGIGFCSYLQTRFGAIVKGIIPIPDMLIPSCYLCDLTPATDQLLHQLYGMPVAYIDNIMDVDGEKWPEIEQSKVRYLAQEMRNAVDQFQQLFNCQVPEPKIQHAIDMRNKLYDAISEIRALSQSDPVPLGQNNYKIIHDLASSCTKRGLQEGVEILNILRKELKTRVTDGKGIIEKGAPRILLTMMPHDPSLADMIEKSGLAISGTATVSTPSASGRSLYESLWEKMAEVLMKRRGANYSSCAYILQLKELAQLWGVDGLIFWYHYSCRQYSIFSLRAKELIEKDLGIPVLLLEGDFCDFRSYNGESMRTKIETFSEIIKRAKERNECGKGCRD